MNLVQNTPEYTYVFCVLRIAAFRISLRSRKKPTNQTKGKKMKTLIILSVLSLGQFSTAFANDATEECRTVVKYSKSFSLNPAGEDKCNAYLAEIASTTEGVVVKSRCTLHTPSYKGDSYKYIAYILKDIGACN